MKMPETIGVVHFIGIGGIGMSGIAEVLHNLGYSVQGSDVAESANVRRLRDQGITVHIGHDAANLADAQVMVVSSAIRQDNPEMIAARSRLIPVVRRAEMLAELMRLKWSVAIGGTAGAGLLLGLAQLPAARRMLTSRLAAGELGLDSALEEAIVRTRRFARKQRSWFRRDPRIRWLRADDPGDLVETLTGSLAGQP
jgi:hypothetical protein